MVKCNIAKEHSGEYRKLVAAVSGYGYSKQEHYIKQRAET
jgi:hypothetical protein